MNAEKCYEAVQETNIVILQPVKNLIFFFSSQKIKRGIPSALQSQNDRKRQTYKNFGTVSLTSYL
jgi:hypothetical protein